MAALLHLLNGRTGGSRSSAPRVFAWPLPSLMRPQPPYFFLLFLFTGERCTYSTYTRDSGVNWRSGARGNKKRETSRRRIWNYATVYAARVSFFSFLFAGTPAITARCRLRNVAVPEFRTTNESLEQVRVQSCVEIGSICYPSIVRKLKETGKACEWKRNSYFTLIYLAYFIFRLSVFWYFMIDRYQT